MYLIKNIRLRRPFDPTGTSTWEQNLREQNLRRQRSLQAIQKDWTLLHALFQRSYWSRMWIVQELRLSRGWVLLCGQKHVDWTYIKELCIGLHNQSRGLDRRTKTILDLACWKTQGVPPRPQFPKRVLPNPHFITGTPITLGPAPANPIFRKPIPRKGHTKPRRGCFTCKRRRIKCNAGVPECSHCIKAGLQCKYTADIVQVEDRLTTLIRRCKEQECADPRDKIYALLGLVPVGGHEIAVDYALSNIELYGQVLKSTLKCEARFALNDTLARGFERDLSLALHIPGDAAAVITEKQNFLDWCWAIQKFSGRNINASSDIAKLPLSVFNAENFQPSRLAAYAADDRTRWTGKECRLHALRERMGEESPLPGLEHSDMPRYDRFRLYFDTVPQPLKQHLLFFQGKKLGMPR